MLSLLFACGGGGILPCVDAEPSLLEPLLLSAVLVGPELPCLGGRLPQGGGPIRSLLVLEVSCAAATPIHPNAITVPRNRHNLVFLIEDLLACGTKTSCTYKLRTAFSSSGCRQEEKYIFSNNAYVLKGNASANGRNGTAKLRPFRDVAERVTVLRCVLFHHSQKRLGGVA